MADDCEIEAMVFEWNEERADFQLRIRELEAELAVSRLGHAMANVVIGGLLAQPMRFIKPVVDSLDVAMMDAVRQRAMDDILGGPPLSIRRH